MFDEAPKSPVAVGTMLAGKYRVDGILGAGGMGIVVAATHEELEQRVAIKFLLAGGVTNADLVNRFVREGKSASRLKSEHVAKVIDVGRLEDGAPYIVMEYLEGDDLGALLRRDGPFPVDLAARYVLQAIEAIAEAHAAKIIHRDLKPANLFLTRRVNGDPLVKVLDFGVSKALDGTHMALTRSQSLLGSPLYMSPEQMRSSKNVDTRADIWSLGVILYELLTGRYPFESETVPGLVFQVTMQDPTPPREHRPEIPPDIEAVILRCLSKSAEGRYANVAELAHALEPYAGHAARGAGAGIAAVLQAPPRRTFASVTNEDADPLDVTHATGPKVALVGPPPGTPPPGAHPISSPGIGSNPGVRAATPVPTDPPAGSSGRVEAIGAASAWGNTRADAGGSSRKPLPWIAAIAVGAAVVAGGGVAVFAFGVGPRVTGDRNLVTNATTLPPPATSSAALPDTSQAALLAPVPSATPSAPVSAAVAAPSGKLVGGHRPGLPSAAPSGKSSAAPSASVSAPPPVVTAPPPPVPSGPPGFVPY